MYELLLEGKISFVWTCDGKEIKATDCIIKVAITRGNITWRSFALRACASNNKKRMTTSASLYEGPILYFYVFTFYARVNSVLLYSFLFFSFASIMWWGRSYRIESLRIRKHLMYVLHMDIYGDHSYPTRYMCLDLSPPHDAWKREKIKRK